MTERNGNGAVREPRQDLVEELLELLWTSREAGAPPVRRDAPEAALEDETRHGQEQEGLHGRMAEAIADATRLGWVAPDGNEVRFSAAGEERARALVRRHRLAGHLFRAVLELGDDVSAEWACRLEHLLSPEVTDSVCGFLGHPRTGTDGRPIPAGPCCERPEADVEPAVVPLTKFPIGVDARVVFVASRRHARVDRLAALGLVPGVRLRLHQRRPGFVVSLGETTLALDAEIADEIYVRRMGDTGSRPAVRSG
jgi:DtxR family Mn-dependent transcriptional regulator